MASASRNYVCRLLRKVSLETAPSTVNYRECAPRPRDDGGNQPIAPSGMTGRQLRSLSIQTLAKATPWFKPPTGAPYSQNELPVAAVQLLPPVCMDTSFDPDTPLGVTP